MYENMHHFRLKQLHFHTKDNDSFLRFHRPDKYGDNLTDIRSTVKYVNENEKHVNGFEEGRIFNGYRFVYPLNYNGEHIGSVESSVSMKSIVDELKKEITQNIDFIIKKEIVDKKVFKNEQSNYRDCKLNIGYYHEKSISSKENEKLEFFIKKYIDENKDFHTLIKKGELFSFVQHYRNNYFITTFLPIKNAISKETVAYIVLSRLDRTLSNNILQYRTYLFILILLISVIAYFLYKTDFHKRDMDHKNDILEEIQKVGHLGYWEFDIVNNEFVWSDEVYHIFGLPTTLNQSSYEQFISLVHKEDRERVNKIFTNSIKNKKDFHLECRIITTAQEIKYLEIECRHTIDKDKNVVQSLGTIHDISEQKIYQLEVEKAKSQFKSLVAHIPDIIYRCELDENYTMLYLNDSVKTITGYSSDDLVLNRVISFANIIHHEDSVDVYNKINRNIKNGIDNFKVEYRIITKDQKTIWVSDHIEVVRENGYKYLEGVISDITSTKEAYAKLYKFIETQDNIVILSDGDEIKFANKKFFDFFNYEDLDEFKKEHSCIDGKFIENDKFFNQTMIKEDQNWIEAILELPRYKRIVSLIGRDFNIYSYSITINKFEDDLYIISFTDISETLIENIKLHTKTIHDKLTNAYNREYFDLNCEKLISDTLLNNTRLGVTLIDIDFFKRINDTYGHSRGDAVLVELVSVIKRFSRHEDILIRWGGEEFLLLMKVETLDSLKKALDHLKVVIKHHYFKEVENLTCSFGATLYQEGEDINETIKRADSALYTSKEQGRDKITID